MTRHSPASTRVGTAPAEEELQVEPDTSVSSRDSVYGDLARERPRDDASIRAWRRRGPGKVKGDLRMWPVDMAGFTLI